MSETNRFTVTVYDDDRLKSYGLTLAESLEWQTLNGRAADAPAEQIRIQASIPGADLSSENPLVRYSYAVPANWVQMASWLDTRVIKPATASWQRDDNQIPDTLEG